MPSRRALLAATSTLACLAVLGAVAIGSGTQSRAGKTTAAAPIVKTDVKTTKRTVHVKNRKTIKVVRSSPAGSAGAVAVAASAEQVGSDPTRASQAVARSEAPSYREADDHGEGGHEDAYEGEHEREAAVEAEEHEEEGDD